MTAAAYITNDMKAKSIIDICKDLEKNGQPDHRAGWTPMVGGHNEILKGRGFFVSYNGNNLTRQMNAIQGFPASMGLSSDQPETALVVSTRSKTKPRKYLIISGDHREAYEKLIPKGKKACLAYFKKQQPIYGHFWSDSL